MTDLTMMEALRLARVALAERHDLRLVTYRSEAFGELGVMVGSNAEAAQAARAYNLIAEHHARLASAVAELV